MRVAMTGGGGFLGSHLLARLIGAGSLVTLVGPELGPSRYTASMVAAGRARFVRCDPDFTDGVAAQSIADASALVLMDSLPQPSASPPERLVDEVEASLAPLVPLLCAFASRGGHVVFASSGAVYGDPVRTPSRESDLPRPGPRSPSPGSRASTRCGSAPRQPPLASCATARSTDLASPGRT